MTFGAKSLLLESKLQIPPLVPSRGDVAYLW
jgi:hypothetical protein